MLPQFDLARWHGPDINDENDVKGWSLVIQWGPLIVELCSGRVCQISQTQL